jgi:soluble lytic murein transglycosylase-like protein
MGHILAVSFLEFRFVRWIVPAAVFAALLTVGAPEANNALTPSPRIKKPIAFRFPVPLSPDKKTVLRTGGMEITVSMEMSVLRAECEILVSRLLPQETAPKVREERTGLNEAGKRLRLYESIIREAAGRHDVDEALVKAVIMAESGYNPFAISEKGARGLMQLMPDTARDLGVKDIFNPAHNINGGVRYLKLLLMQFKGDVALALAAYHAGMARVFEHNGVPPIDSTKAYIEKVLLYYEHFNGGELGGENA